MATRRKTRSFLTAKTRGRPLLSSILKILTPGDIVMVDYNPSYQKGISHRRFQGQTGKVLRRWSNNFYSVLINKKVLITTPPHLIQLT